MMNMKKRPVRWKHSAAQDAFVFVGNLFDVRVALFEQLAGIVESVLIYKAAEIYSQRPLKDARYVLIIVPKGVRRRF